MVATYHIKAKRKGLLSAIRRYRLVIALGATPSEVITSSQRGADPLTYSSCWLAQAAVIKLNSLGYQAKITLTYK